VWIGSIQESKTEQGDKNMTCIVAVTNGQSVLIGGDSAGVREHEMRVRANAKVFRVGSYAIGFTSSFRMGQILQHSTQLPEPPAGVDPADLERFMVVEFVDALRQVFKDSGFAKTLAITRNQITESGQEVAGVFLVGVIGQIFEIREDYHVARPATPYSAVGLGAQLAFGALHALESFPELSLQERTLKALEASEAFSAVVRGPFQLVEVP
jgi:ATP-dependent protease HslVU (ClpYQ) peptidase subunit